MHPHMEFVIMEQYVYQKNINYVPDYFSGLSHALLCFFPTTFLEIAVYINGCLAILKNLRCLQLKKELNDKKDRVKVSHYL